MRNVFISYHHRLDQQYKRDLCTMAINHSLFHDQSVGIGEIDDNLSDETIRRIIRDQYLRETSVSIVLVGQETAGRKHVDWEIASSMWDGPVSRQSGIVVIELPTIPSHGPWIAFPEQHAVHGTDPMFTVAVDSKTKLLQYHPCLPARIIDNLLAPSVKIPVVQWREIVREPWKLKWLVDKVGDHARYNEYSHSVLRRERNSPNSGAFGDPLVNSLAGFSVPEHKNNSLDALLAAMTYVPAPVNTNGIFSLMADSPGKHDNHMGLLAALMSPTKK